jgi:hypothetical protein
MIYTLKSKDGLKLTESENIKDIYNYVFNNDTNIKKKEEEKNKEMIFITSSNVQVYAYEYVLKNYKMYCRQV